MLEPGGGSQERPTAAVSPQRADSFWFVRHPNFGDLLAPVFLDRYAGIRARWTPAWRADVVVIGSIAGRLPHRYRGVVAGVGKLEGGMELDLSRAKVLGLRGELTRKGSGARGNLVLGDPGLLAADYLGERPEQIHELGVVPHFKDLDLAQRYPGALHIHPSQEPRNVISMIASCKRIVASSLHGLVTADAFGIERRWEPYDGMMGPRFKYADYASALGIPMEPFMWTTAPGVTVQRIVAELRDMFAGLGPEVAASRRARREGMWRVLERVR